MTTTSSWLATAAARASAPLARLQERVLGLRQFELLRVPAVSALTVVCDDGESADLDVAEVLAERGVRGVFAVSPALIGRPGFLSYAQLGQLRDAGHEIAFHGTTHEPFTQRRRVGLRTSIQEGLQRLADEGFTASTLVYPYGANHGGVRATVASLFACAFTTWFGLNERVANRYAIRRIPLGAYSGRSAAAEAWYRGCLERAARGHCWPTFMLHPGVAAHTREHTAMLGRLLEQAQQLGVPVRTARQHLLHAAEQATTVVRSATARASD